MTTRAAAVLVLATSFALACKPPDEPPNERPREVGEVQSPAPVIATNTTINEFYARGVPTFVIGTAGDDAADRAIALQVELIRGAVFPAAEVVADSTIAEAWPSNPVVYGGAHMCSLIASLELPLEIDAGHLKLGDRSFDGDGYQIITVVPAGPRNPEFLLYAGTGTPGVTEINSVSHGAESILVIDAFGRLVTGSWASDGQRLVAKLDPPARRIDWRFVDVEVGGVKARVGFPAQLDAATDEAEVIAAVERGVARSSERLALVGPVGIDVYVYPDRRSKLSLTGDQGDGHAVPMADALHVLRSDPTPGGGFESLVAHEVTHLLSHHGWGSAGMPLLGEGLAVYVAGQYGGVSLEQWATQLDAAPPLSELLGSGFRSRPEQETYPVAGLLVRAAIELVGIDAVREHLYGATAATWSDACERAGTSATALEQALVAALAK